MSLAQLLAFAALTQLRLTTTIPLPGVEGRIDHMAVDGERGRLFVAALGNRTVEIVDLKTGRRVKSLEGWTEPQGVCFVADTNRLFVTDASGEVAMLDGASFSRLRVVHFRMDADNIRVDAKSRRIYVGFGGGGLGIVDAASGDSIGVIPLPAHPESFQLEDHGNRIFANLPETGVVAVIDRAERRIIDSWSLGGAGSNFPMALDGPHHRLFVGCRRPPKLLIYDTTTGRLAQSLPLCGDVDDLFFDGERGRLYASCGDGFLDVFGVRGTEWLNPARVRTASGARTALFVPEDDALYLAVPHRGKQSAQIRLYEISAH